MVRVIISTLGAPNLNVHRRILRFDLARSGSLQVFFFILKIFTSAFGIVTLKLNRVYDRCMIAKVTPELNKFELKFQSRHSSRKT